MGLSPANPLALTSPEQYPCWAETRFLCGLLVSPSCVQIPFGGFCFVGGFRSSPLELPERYP